MTVRTASTPRQTQLGILAFIAIAAVVLGALRFTGRVGPATAPRAGHQPVFPIYVAHNLISDGDFEAFEAGETPPGWRLMDATGASCAITEQGALAGKRSLAVSLGRGGVDGAGVILERTISWSGGGGRPLWFKAMTGGNGRGSVSANIASAGAASMTVLPGGSFVAPAGTSRFEIQLVVTGPAGSTILLDELSLSPSRPR